MSFNSTTGLGLVSNELSNYPRFKRWLTAAFGAPMTQDEMVAFSNAAMSEMANFPAVRKLLAAHGNPVGAGAIRDVVAELQGKFPKTAYFFTQLTH